MRLSVPFGSILGAKLRLHPLLLVMVALAWRFGALPEYLTAFTLVFLHEMCHSLAARALGVEVLEIELAPFGGVARMGADLELQPSREIVIALAGPAANVLMVLLAALADRYFSVPPEPLSVFISTNLLLAGFNLMPALPLDGGRVLRAALAIPLGLSRATKLAAAIGCALGVAILTFAVMGALQGVINATYFICGPMLALMALREWRGAMGLYIRDITARDRALKKDGALPVRQIAVPSDATVASVMRRFRPRSYHRVVILDNALTECAEITEGDIVRAMMSNRAACAVKEIAAHRRGLR